MALISGLRTALSTLSIIPTGKDYDADFGNSLVWFPAVGLIIGCILGGVWKLWIVMGIGYNEGLAGLMVLAQLILTGCLHLDGVADFGDAIGSRKDQSAKLMIMKDSHIGAFGASSIVMDLLLKYILFRRVIELNLFIPFINVMVISRAMMVELISTLNYARGEKGTGWPFVSSSTKRTRYITLLISFTIIFIGDRDGFSMVLFLSGLLFTLALRIFYKRMFGGITGDLMGASNEMNELLLLFICAVS